MGKVVAIQDLTLIPGTRAVIGTAITPGLGELNGRHGRDQVRPVGAPALLSYSAMAVVTTCTG